FDTSNVTNMSWMFYGTSSLLSLDFRNATFNKEPSYASMFSGIKSGAIIYTKDDTTKAWLQDRLSEAGKTGSFIIP
ncbi:MAG: hypothetical protein PHW32_04110, partial [Bacilli bacterium]|nr:hypothetical protein [Bacilli bacterium]